MLQYVPMFWRNLLPFLGEHKRLVVLSIYGYQSTISENENIISRYSSMRTRNFVQFTSHACCSTFQHTVHLPSTGRLCDWSRKSTEVYVSTFLLFLVSFFQFYLYFLIHFLHFFLLYLVEPLLNNDCKQSPPLDNSFLTCTSEQQQRKCDGCAVRQAIIKQQ